MKAKTAFTTALTVRSIIASLWTLGLFDVMKDHRDINLLFHDREIVCYNGCLQTLESNYCIKIQSNNVCKETFDAIAKGPNPDGIFFDTNIMHSEVLDMPVSMVSVSETEYSIEIIMAIPKLARTVEYRKQNPNTGGCANDN